MLRHLVFLLILFFAPLSQAQPYCKEPLPANATYENLRDKIRFCRLMRIDDVIPLLPKAHLSNYTLMYHSQSLHEADVLSPRAILYGDDAKLIITFNGDPSQSHYQNLEIMTFRDATKTFETRDIDFSEARTKGVQFSKPNPDLCVSCHLEDLRPSWSTYPLWPGAFGGEDDGVYRPNHPSTVDDANYRKFLKEGKSKGRYKSLALRQAAALPNTRFAGLLHNLNMQRISRRLTQTALLQPFRYALLGALSCFYSDHHNAIEGFVPPSLLKTKFKKSYSTLYEDTASANRTAFLGKVEYLQTLIPEAPEEEKVATIASAYQENPNGIGRVSDHIVAALRFIVENLGGDTGDWSMEILYGSYDFENGYVGIADLKGVLADVALSGTKSDKALRDRLKITGPESSKLDGLCHDLQTSSQNELKRAFNL